MDEQKINEEEHNICRAIPSVGARSTEIGLNNFSVRKKYNTSGGEHKNEYSSLGLIRST